MSQHRKSVANEIAELTDAARAEGVNEGVRLGIRLAAIYLDRRGAHDFAAELRAARIVAEEPAEAVAAE